MRLLRLSLLACLGSLQAMVHAQPWETRTLSDGGLDVPVEIARPDGTGPWPPVLYIHARRGFEDVDRAHMRALARDGFLVLAPDWLTSQMLERWPDRHHPQTEADVAAALDALLRHPDACRQAAGIVAKSRGPYFAIRLAAARPADVATIVSWYGHFQHPNAPEPQQLFSVAPEVAQLRAPVLMLLGDADFEVRRIVNGRAFYMLWERGVPVELQMYPMARRAFDFRADQSPEEKTATRHAMQRERDWLRRHMALDENGRCRNDTPPTRSRAPPQGGTASGPAQQAARRRRCGAGSCPRSGREGAQRRPKPKPDPRRSLD